jgi:hypothetical protein
MRPETTQRPSSGEIVENPPRSSDEHPRDRVPFQFGLGRLFILTSACAGVLAAVSTMEAPVLFRLGVALYLMVMAAYVILRIPHIYQIWRQIHRRCQGLETLVVQAGATTKETRDASAEEQTKNSSTPGQPDG